MSSLDAAEPRKQSIAPPEPQPEPEPVEPRKQSVAPPEPQLEPEPVEPRKQSVASPEPQPEPEPVIIVIEPSEDPKPEPQAAEPGPKEIAVVRDENGTLVLVPVTTPPPTPPAEPQVDAPPPADPANAPSVIDFSLPELPFSLPELPSLPEIDIIPELPEIDIIPSRASTMQSRRASVSKSIRPVTRGNTVSSRASTAVGDEEPPVIVIANASRKPSKLSFVQTAASEESASPEESATIVNAPQETGNVTVETSSEVVPVVVKARKRDKLRNKMVPEAALNVMCGKEIGGKVKKLLKDKAESVAVSAVLLGT